VKLRLRFLRFLFVQGSFSWKAAEYKSCPKPEVSVSVFRIQLNRAMQLLYGLITPVVLVVFIGIIPSEDNGLADSQVDI
jgi:hypothetical protein